MFIYKYNNETIYKKIDIILYLLVIINSIIKTAKDLILRLLKNVIKNKSLIIEKNGNNIGRILI